MIDYRKYPCTCGHAEGTHRRVLQGCRGKGCKCPGFLNIAYVSWFEGVVKADAKLLKRLKLDLLIRVNENAGRKLFVLAKKKR